ncbi:hypothetical protein Peur_042848 [Populus x canadensis]|jgi:hypothetical protein
MESGKSIFCRWLTLCQSVLASLLNYTMQSVKLSRIITGEIEWSCRSFDWSEKEGNPKMYIINWDTLCQPKNLVELD